MEPVGPSGEFLIDYSVFDAARAGFNKVVFLICRDIEDDFKATIGARTERHIAVGYAFQELADLPAGYSVPPGRKKPWGTGHAVLACRNAVEGPFAVTNADDFYGRHSYKVLFDFLEQTADNQSLYSMVGFILRNTVSEYGYVARGICRTGDDGQLTNIVERTKIEKSGDEFRYAVDENQWKPLSGDEVVSMNMWGFKPSVFGYLDSEFNRFLQKYISNPNLEFFVPSVIDKMIVEQKVTVTVLETPSSWFGVTYREDKPLAVVKVRELIKSGEYPENLWR